MVYIVDISTVIALNLKTARQRRGLSMQTVAQAVGVSYQQIQKYENGKDRISVVRLYDIACYYSIPIEQFFIP